MMRALKKHLRLPAIILSIVAAVFAVYRPSLKNQFVWDDTALILRDPFIRSWRLIAEGFGHFLFTDATASDFYRPIQRLTYTFDYALYGFDHPWGYHLTNILLHAAAAVMLFFFVKQLIVLAPGAATAKAEVIAWITAIVWAVHPVHTEAVCYIASRADILAALFGFAGLWLGLLAAGGGSRLWAWPAAACFLAAALSKESGIIALAVWLAVLACRGDFRALRHWLIIGAALLAAYCGLRFTAEHTPPPVLAQPPGFAARLILIPCAFDVYAGLLVAPLNLHMERGLPEAWPGKLLLLVPGLLLLAALAVWLLWTRRRLFPAFIFLVAFLIAYAPTSNLFALNATVAEHWLYFSSAFLFAAAALSLAATPVPRTVLLALFACWVGGLGWRTWRRNDDWKDQRTFLETTIEAGGNTPRMLVNLAQLESDEGRKFPALQKIAIEHLHEALERQPDLPFALLELARADMRAHDFDDAYKQLQRAEIIPFVRGEALKDRAALEFQRSGQVDLPLLLKAATLEPENWEIQQTYIKTLAQEGRFNEATAALKTVLDKQWWRSESWKLMAELLESAGRPDLADFARDRANAYDVHLKMTKKQ